MARVLISGAGIAGISLALQLEKHNIDYVLIEKQGQLAKGGLVLHYRLMRSMRSGNPRVLTRLWVVPTKLIV